MKPYYSDESVSLHHGDSLEVLRALPDASVDSVVTDPPYGLADHHPRVVAAAVTAWLTGDREHVPDGKGFMGRDWDSFVPPPALWDECLRVLKPGGHLLAFAAPRTADLMTMSIRLAGFEIRDGIDWLYASGFPKGQDVGKTIDRMRSEDRPAILQVTAWLSAARKSSGITTQQIDDHFGFNGMASHWTTQSRTACLPTVEQWEQLRALIGFGPEMDDEVVRLNARKGGRGANFAAREVIGSRHSGLGSGKTSVFLNGMDGVDERGHVAVTTAASDDAKRWEGWNTSLKPAREPILVARKSTGFNSTVANVLEHGTGALNIAACRVEDPGGVDTLGRWPSNVVLSHAPTCTEVCVPGCPVRELDAQSGTLTSGANPTRRGSDKFRSTYGDFKGQAECTPARGASRGGASRFFPTFRYEGKASASERPIVDGVSHPTVKPLELMRWLVRLVTPPGGSVLEPFAGSGTTAEACVVEGLKCIAIEREADYLPLITARLTKPLQPSLDLFGQEAAA